MPDACYAHPRLAAVYDPLDPDRGDLDAYLRIARKSGARRVLDIGCGTGVFALLLADEGIDVVGVDPAAASLDVARAKPGAGRVRWIEGDATDLPPLTADLATMTGTSPRRSRTPATGTPPCAAPARPCVPAAAWSSRPATRPGAPGRPGPASTRTSAPTCPAPAWWRAGTT